MASSSTDAVLGTQDGHRSGKLPRLEDVTAGDASTVLPMEVLPKFGQAEETPRCHAAQNKHDIQKAKHGDEEWGTTDGKTFL
ncbi:hypothetical protein ACTXT7_016403 [Hymenolepis weldensis]